MLPSRRAEPPLHVRAAGQGRAEQALQTVVDGLTGGKQDRPDTPDGWVTAVRRLPARTAEHTPFPAGVDKRLQRVLNGRGIAQLYTHQASAIDHVLAGRHVVIT